MNRSYWDTSSILADAVRLPCYVARDCPGLAHLQGNEESISISATMSNKQTHDQEDEEMMNQDDDLLKKPKKPSRDTTILKKNTRIDIPFWLAELLALHSIVHLTIPRQYNGKVKNALEAEAKSVQLRNLNSWWYAIGIRLSELMEPNSTNLIETLQHSYLSRISQIFSSGQHLAASMNLRKGFGSSVNTNNNDDQIDQVNASSMNDNVDSLGAYTSISMSSEMVEFINGLEESETQLLKTAQESVSNIQSYLASGH